MDTIRIRIVVDGEEHIFPINRGVTRRPANERDYFEFRPAWSGGPLRVTLHWGSTYRTIYEPGYDSEFAQTWSVVAGRHLVDFGGDWTTCPKCKALKWRGGWEGREDSDLFPFSDDGSLCYRCAHWVAGRASYHTPDWQPAQGHRRARYIIAGGETFHYYDDSLLPGGSSRPARVRGFGGSTFTIEILAGEDAGRVERTNSLWHGRSVPDWDRENFPDTARKSYGE
jgi:hypothetical protein